MINRGVLLKFLSNSEKWYYSSYIKNFIDPRQDTYNDLIDEIYSTPVESHGYIVGGIGKLIGAQMRYDPTPLPGYPLSLEFGDILEDKLKKSFYKGVGAGFCDTFLRAWRTILPPEDISLMRHQEAIELEWQKYMSLMLKLPQEHQAVIYNGFISEIQKRHPGSYIESILLKRFNRTDKHGHYLFPEKKNRDS